MGKGRKLRREQARVVEATPLHETTIQKMEKWAPTAALHGLGVLMSVIVYFVRPSPALLVILLSIAFLSFGFAAFFWPGVKGRLWLRLIALCLIAGCLFMLAYFIWPSEPPSKVSQPTPDVKPQFKLRLSPRYGPPSKYPLQTYDLAIENTNPSSVVATDFRMEIIFRNPIVTVEQKPQSIPAAGQRINLGSPQLWTKDKTGAWRLVKKQSPDISITKNFSIDIKRERVNGRTINTNELRFYCAKWPRAILFVAEIVVDLKKTPEYMRMSPEGVYDGMYFYEINGQVAPAEKVNGSIPEVDEERAKRGD
jgi:hypothetical protein